ncbi:hypothetical protein BGZ76_000713 [Entomortierella beljakovae]|nr:hypothetical protein BGZ76_000713 [Entomortierella beljakovae]
MTSSLTPKEKHLDTLLPTSSNGLEASLATSQSTIDRHGVSLKKIVGLFFAALSIIYLVIPSVDYHTNNTKYRHDSNQGQHDRKSAKSNRFHFEKHMQSDIDQLVAGSLDSNIVWDRLAEMTDLYGPRLAGTEALEKSIDWVVENIKFDGLSVTTEEVVVDLWQRNTESLHFLSPTRGPVKLHILGLGYSVSTPDPVNGLTAEVIVVHTKDDLDQLGKAGEVKGRVVVWNKPFTSYDVDYIYRASGATWAQEYGAVASLVRSLGPFSLQTPHTGVSEPCKIPAASISAEDADVLERSLHRHQKDSSKFPDWPKVKLVMGATTELNSKTSRNIIIELKGREKPEEIVVVGGHMDSWDVGVGAVDDGAGCFIAWETLRQLSRLEKPPKRTVRVVFWTAEENTSVGGVTYANNHPDTNTSRHVFAFESDTGVFDPYGIAFTAGQSQQGDGATKNDAVKYLVAAGEHFLGPRDDLGYPGAGRYVLPDGEGADIEPLCNRGVACASFTPADPFPLPYSTSPYAIKDTKESSKEQKHPYKRRHHRKHSKHDRRPVDTGYFYYHHTEADSMAAFTPDQLKRSAAVMAIWTYIAAEGSVEF